MRSQSLALEGAKENFQPSQHSGPRITQLTNQVSIGNPKEQLAWHQKIQNERNTYEMRIAEQTIALYETQASKILPSQTISTEDNNPLNLWLLFIKWTEVNLISKETKSREEQRHLLPLLTRCVKRFEHNIQYKNNEKYLRVWLKFINIKSGEQLPMFHIMYNANIAQQFALFWKAWAHVAVTNEEYDFADTIYAYAKQTNAHPRKMIDNAYARFLKQMKGIVQNKGCPPVSNKRFILPPITGKTWRELVSTKTIPKQKNQSRNDNFRKQQQPTYRPSTSMHFNVNNDQNSVLTNDSENINIYDESENNTNSINIGKSLVMEGKDMYKNMKAEAVETVETCFEERRNIFKREQQKQFMNNVYPIDEVVDEEEEQPKYETQMNKFGHNFFNNFQMRPQMPSPFPLSPNPFDDITTNSGWQTTREIRTPLRKLDFSTPARTPFENTMRNSYLMSNGDWNHEPTEEIGITRLIQNPIQITNRRIGDTPERSLGPLAIHNYKCNDNTNSQLTICSKAEMLQIAEQNELPVLQNCNGGSMEDNTAYDVYEDTNKYHFQGRN